MLQNTHPMTTEQLAEGIHLPPIGDSNNQPPGVSQVEGDVGGRTAQNGLYRSVPPKQGSYTLTDMYGAPKQRINVVSTNAPSEYAERFKSRPTQKPKVVAFDGGAVSPEHPRRRRINGFFPPVKIRKAVRLQSTPEDDELHQPAGKMHLVPTAYSEMRTRSVCSRANGMMGSSRMTPDTIRTSITMPEGIVYPNIISENMDYDDLSYLPPPKKILPRREIPWVFRYKVKRNMNELAKIMASKPPSTQPQRVVDQAS